MTIGGNEYRAIPVQKLPDSVLPSFEEIFFQRPGLVTDGFHPSEQKNIREMTFG